MSTTSVTLDSAGNNSVGKQEVLALNRVLLYFFSRGLLARKKLGKDLIEPRRSLFAK